MFVNEAMVLVVLPVSMLSQWLGWFCDSTGVGYYDSSLLWRPFAASDLEASSGCLNPLTKSFTFRADAPAFHLADATHAASGQATEEHEVVDPGSAPPPADDKLEFLANEYMNLLKRYFRVGDQIVVDKGVTSDSADEVELRAGLRGTIEKLDDQGDAYIRFEGLQKQWIFLHKLGFLSRAGPDQELALDGG